MPQELQKSYPIKKFSEGSVKKIVCGNSHCLLQMYNGQLYGFGGNEEGQLGLKVSDSTRYIDSPKKISINVNNLNRFIIKDIAAGDNFSLVLIRQDEVDYIVQFSLDKTDKYRIKSSEHINVRVDYSPSNSSEIGEIENIYAFGQRKMFITSQQKIFVGGIDFKNNDLEEYIELKGFGGSDSQGNKRKVTSFHMGMNHCVILADDGCLYGLGDNTYGELGNKKMKCDLFQKIPTNFESKIKEISSGARHLLILLENGDLYCMGDNSEGQCFSYSLRLSEPIKVELETNLKVVHCFSGTTHNLIVLENGNVMTWGDAFGGKLGNGEEFFSQPFPQVVLRLKQKEIYKVGLGFQMSVIATGKV